MLKVWRMPSVNFSMEDFCSTVGDQGLIPADTAFAVLDGSVKCQLVFKITIKTRAGHRQKYPVCSILYSFWNEEF